MVAGRHSILAMLRILVDTSVWLDLAQRRDGQKWIEPIRVLMHQGQLQLLVPALVLKLLMKVRFPSRTTRSRYLLR